MPQVTTEHGTDENGKLLYSREEYEKLNEDADRLGDAAFSDLVTAEAEGRVVDADNAQPARKTWTRAEYREAAKRTDQMTADEFAAWESAPDEGRVTD